MSLSPFLSRYPDHKPLVKVPVSIGKMPSVTPPTLWVIVRRQIPLNFPAEEVGLRKPSFIPCHTLP
jgi:hypothetical protein